MSITFNPNPTTALEAVNLMLLSIGKSPVNTLSIPGVNDVSQATTVLYTVTRDVQKRGWWFNREPGFPILPDTLGNIQIPNTVIDITPDDRYRNYVERNGKLYDLDNHTFNIGQYLSGQPLKCEVVWCFDFETIPQAARSYIARRAGREFQACVIGSQILYQFTKEMEVDAAAELERSETKNSKTNMFTAPTRNNRITNRQPGASRRNW